MQEVRHSSSNAGEKPGALTALVSSPDGRVWAGFKHGRLEVYTSAGRLFWKKVRPRDEKKLGCLCKNGHRMFEQQSVLGVLSSSFEPWTAYQNYSFI